ncbi:isochorismatase family protein [Streptomyces sp. NPDC005181]|uniref:isochorismatase family protein n=1 Tax=Streptomyces sp. NPDC005181 TaxID=3156869 RepID=UPI0033B147CB
MSSRNSPRIGMRANTCIDTTARFAQELGHHVTLIKDAIAAFRREDASDVRLPGNIPGHPHIHRDERGHRTATHGSHPRSVTPSAAVEVASYGTPLVM